MAECTKEKLRVEFARTSRGHQYLSISDSAVVVRVGYNKQKRPIHYAAFSTNKYTSLLEFMSAVCQFRTTAISQLEESRKCTPTERRAECSNKRVPTGISGLSLREATSATPGYYSWQASWYVDGKQYSAAFSVNKWGYAVAKDRAKACLFAKANLFTNPG